MSDTTSAIETKKQEISNNTLKSDSYKTYVSFVMTIVVLFIKVFLYFAVGGLTLFCCKVAVAQIIPTDISTMPYSVRSPTDIQDVQTNNFNTFDGRSIKMTFPYCLDCNSSNIILDLMLKSQVNGVFNLVQYFMLIFRDLIATNYLLLQMFFSALSNFPETVIVLIGPILLHLVLGIMVLVNTAYCALLFLYHLQILLSVNINQRNDNDGISQEDIGNNPKPAVWKWFWYDMTGFSLFNMAYVIGMFCLLMPVLFLIFIIFILSVFPVPLIPIFGALWCFFSLLGYKGQINNIMITSYTYLQYVFMYFRTVFLVVFMLFVTKDALSQLGAVAGIIVFIMSIFFIKQIRSDTKLDLPVELLTKISSSSKVKAVCRRQNRLQVGGGNIMKYLKKFKSLEATNE